MVTRIFIWTVSILLTGAAVISQGWGAGRVIEVENVNFTTERNLGPEGLLSQNVLAVFTDCDIAVDNCGSIDPNPDTYSYWLADGANNTGDGTLFFVDVPTYNGVFQVDPATCIVVEGTFYQIHWRSDRGIGYDPEYHQIWAGSWGDYVLRQHSAIPPYEWISQANIGVPIASIAVDDEHNYLFVGANSYPDMLYVYDITGGELVSLLGSWRVPWQSASNGWDMAGMSFDDDAGQLVMVNQYGSYSGTVREIFDFSITEGLSGAGYCELASTSFGWGIAVVDDGDPIPTSFDSYVTDIGDFSEPIDLDWYGIPAVYPPYDLVCEVTDENGVILTWTNAEEYDAVRIYRDSGLLATLPGHVTSYLDASPGIGYHTYGVSGVVGSDESIQARCEVNIYPPGQTCFDFNSTDGGWTAGGTTNGWEWGIPTYPFPGKAWETAIGGYYDANACTWLDSPPIIAGHDGMWVTFNTYDYTECYWDGWTLEISTDGGTSWSCIVPLEGYDQGEPYGAGNCPEFGGCDSNCGYGLVRSWNFDLTGMPDVSARFRFVFASDASVQYYGVVMDDFCIYGGAVPSVMVQCQLLNPDMDGDGVRDVHVGDYMYYSATFVNLTPDPVDYGAEHLFYAIAACPPDHAPIDRIGPRCKGTLPGGGVRTHYYRVSVPNNDNLMNWNPWAWEIASWQCTGGDPQFETDRCCFDVMLLPAWEPPPVPGPMSGFFVEEIETLPAFRR